MMQKKSLKSEQDILFDNLSELDKSMLINWADSLEAQEIPKEMDKRLRENIKQKIIDNASWDENKPMGNLSQKRNKKVFRKIAILAATITILLSLGLSAGMIDFRNLYIAKEKALMSMAGNKNVYGQQYTSDIYDQYATLSKEIGKGFFVPMYVPESYVLESIQKSERDNYISLTFMKEDAVFTIRQTLLGSDKNETYNVLIEDNFVAIEDFDWGSGKAIVYESTLEQGDITYAITYNYTNTSLRLFGALSKEEAIKTFKLLVKYEGQ